LPSAYSSARFAEYMANMKNVRCVVSGFSLDETVLSTVVDGFHRSHRYQIVGDAVACRRAGVGDADSYKMAVVNVIGNYAGILQSSDLTETSTATAV
jgi:nicotinamidase-related amidase